MPDTPSLTVTRDHLADLLREFDLAPSKKAGGEIVDFIARAIAGALKAGNAVHLRGFGRFAVADTPERPGRNPKTGEPHTVAAKRRVKFKASKKLLGEPEIAR